MNFAIHCTVPYYRALHCAVLFCAALYRPVPPHSVTPSASLFHVTLSFARPPPPLPPSRSRVLLSAEKLRLHIRTAADWVRSEIVTKNRDLSENYGWRCSTKIRRYVKCCQKGTVLPSKGRKAYVVCKLNATYTFLPLDNRVIHKGPGRIQDLSRGGGWAEQKLSYTVASRVRNIQPYVSSLPCWRPPWPFQHSTKLWNTHCKVANHVNQRKKSIKPSVFRSQGGLYTWLYLHGKWYLKKWWRFDVVAKQWLQDSKTNGGLSLWFNHDSEEHGKLQNPYSQKVLCAPWGFLMCSLLMK